MLVSLVTTDRESSSTSNNSSFEQFNYTITITQLTNNNRHDIRLLQIGRYQGHLHSCLLSLCVCVYDPLCPMCNDISVDVIIIMIHQWSAWSFWLVVIQETFSSILHHTADTHTHTLIHYKCMIHCYLQREDLWKPEVTTIHTPLRYWSGSWLRPVTMLNEERERDTQCHWRNSHCFVT